MTTDDMVKTCRNCRTAFRDAFPRMNCVCGKNDAEADPVPHTVAPADSFTSDPYSYDMTSGMTPEAVRAKWQDVILDDPTFWWL